MTDQATRVVPAGWYEDPASSMHVRWWNGLAWTEHTADKPQTPPAPAPTDHAARTTVPDAAGGTAEREVVSGAAVTSGYQRSWQTEAVAEPVPASRTATASAWLIALWPVLTGIVVVLAAYVVFYFTREPSFAGIPLVFAAVVVPYLLVLLWAITDARKLRRLGHRPPSAALALLGPLGYLIARRLRVRGSGPLVTLIVLTLLVGGGPIAAYFTGYATPIVTALRVQQTVSDDLISSGQAVAVKCPSIIDSRRVGAVYTCNAELRDGSEVPVFVTVTSADGDFDYSLTAP